MWVWITVVTIAIYVAWRWYSASKKLEEVRESSEIALKNIFELEPYEPHLDVTWSYGYPSFEITFDSSGDLRDANEAGLTAKIREDIQERFKSVNPSNEPFDAERAVFFTSKEEVEEMLEKTKRIKALDVAIGSKKKKNDILEAASRHIGEAPIEEDGGIRIGEHKFVFDSKERLVNIDSGLRLGDDVER